MISFLFDFKFLVQAFVTSPAAKPGRQRYKTWNEIISSEKAYVEKLNFIIQVQNIFSLNN